MTKIKAAMTDIVDVDKTLLLWGVTLYDNASWPFLIRGQWILRTCFSVKMPIHTWNIISELNSIAECGLNSYCKHLNLNEWCLVSSVFCVYVIPASSINYSQWCFVILGLHWAQRQDVRGALLLFYYATLKPSFVRVSAGQLCFSQRFWGV